MRKKIVKSIFTKKDYTRLISGPLFSRVCVPLNKKDKFLFRFYWLNIAEYIYSLLYAADAALAAFDIFLPPTKALRRVVYMSRAHYKPRT